MAEITNLTPTIIKPSDVFGYEVNTDVGYGRETFNITGATTAKPVRVGTVFVVDYATMTATPADGATVTTTSQLGVFVGRDLPTNPTTSQDFARLTQTADGKGVLIVKGDGRGILKRGYLDFAGTQYYALTETQRKTIDTAFTTLNRFKMVDQQYTPAV